MTRSRHAARESARRATLVGRELTAGEIAWLLSVPCALLTVAAMLVLGRPLGNLLQSTHGQITILPEYDGAIFLKPAQQARYFIAVAAAALLAAATLGIAQRPPRLRQRTTDLLVSASQCAGAAFIVVCFWVQRTVKPPPANGIPASIQPFFTVPTLLVASALAALAALAVRHEPLRGRVAEALSGNRRGITVIGVSAAVVITAIWLLASVNFADTIRNASGGTIYNIKGPLDETFAVLDGRTPLVNFTATYGSLWPYVTALSMSVFGTSLGVFSVTMGMITGLSLLAVFAILRRVSGSALAALLLYLPFLATGFFESEPGSVNRSGPLNLYSMYPIRYGGPYLLAWLVARQLDGGRPRARWIVFLAAGLVVLNNVDFGIAAVGATVAAMLWVDTPLRWGGIGRLLRDALGGLLGAYALVSILTLARTGSPVELGVLLFYPRLFADSGFALLPTQPLGMHIVVYLTYVAAVGLATVRAIRGDPGRTLTGLLAWSGVFGLGAGVYYMGRSGSGQLFSMFSAWALALALLTLAAVQQIARDPKPRLSLAHVAVFFGMGLAICSLAQTPAPWTQIERLQKRAAPLLYTSSRLKQILIHYGGGRPEAIMDVLGHRVAYEAGVVNVSPYIGALLIVTTQQVSNTLHALRAAGGHLLVLPLANTYPNFYLAVCKAGFSFIGSTEINFELEGSKAQGLTLWSAPVLGVAPRPCPVSAAPALSSRARPPVS
jgi:hypothetical protein